jgi:ankyrin repeat protein
LNLCITVPKQTPQLIELVQQSWNNREIAIFRNLPKDSTSLFPEDTFSLWLHTATKENRVDFVKALALFNRVNINIRVNGTTPLHEAAKIKSMRLCFELCILGADINALTNDGSLPLHLFVEGDFPKNIPLNEFVLLVAVIEQLSDESRLINTGNARGETPLRIATATQKNSNPLVVVLNYCGGTTKPSS